MNLVKLSDSELEIMLIIWHANQAVDSSYVLEQLHTRKWKLPTLMTVLKRLITKEYLICEKEGRFNRYKYIIDEKTYKKTESKSMLEKLHGNSFKKLVASLYEGDAIKKEDIKEIQALLAELEEKGV